MFVGPEMGYVRAKIGLTGQFDRSQPGNYLQPCSTLRVSKSKRRVIHFLMQWVCRQGKAAFPIRLQASLNKRALVAALTRCLPAKTPCWTRAIVKAKLQLKRL